MNASPQGQVAAQPPADKSVAPPTMPSIQKPNLSHIEAKAPRWNSADPGHAKGGHTPSFAQQEEPRTAPQSADQGNVLTEVAIQQGRSTAVDNPASDLTQNTAWQRDPPASPMIPNYPAAESTSPDDFGPPPSVPPPVAPPQVTSSLPRRSIPSNLNANAGEFKPLTHENLVNQRPRGDDLLDLTSGSDSQLQGGHHHRINDHCKTSAIRSAASPPPYEASSKSSTHSGRKTPVGQPSDRSGFHFARVQEYVPRSRAPDMRVLSSTRLTKFRTAKCLKKFNHVWKDCDFSHARFIRRDTSMYMYSPNLCSHFSYNQDMLLQCQAGINCRFCHSKEEVNYHPLRYKTVQCRTVSTGETCVREFCPYWHSEMDQSRMNEDLELITLALVGLVSVGSTFFNEDGTMTSLALSCPHAGEIIEFLRQPLNESIRDWVFTCCEISTSALPPISEFGQYSVAKKMKMLTEYIEHRYLHVMRLVYGRGDATSLHDQLIGAPVRGFQDLSLAAAVAASGHVVHSNVHQAGFNEPNSLLQGSFPFSTNTSAFPDLASGLRLPWPHHPTSHDGRMMEQGLGNQRGISPTIGVNGTVLNEDGLAHADHSTFPGLAIQRENESDSQASRRASNMLQTPNGTTMTDSRRGSANSFGGALPMLQQPMIQSRRSSAESSFRLKNDQLYGNAANAMTAAFLNDNTTSDVQPNSPNFNGTLNDMGSQDQGLSQFYFDQHFNNARMPSQMSAGANRLQQSPNTPTHAPNNSRSTNDRAVDVAAVLGAIGQLSDGLHGFPGVEGLDLNLLAQVNSLQQHAQAQLGQGNDLDAQAQVLLAGHYAAVAAAASMASQQAKAAVVQARQTGDTPLNPSNPNTHLTNGFSAQPQGHTYQQVTASQDSRTSSPSPSANQLPLNPNAAPHNPMNVITEETGPLKSQERSALSNLAKLNRLRQDQHM